MKWTEVKILTTNDANEAIADMLVNVGSKGVAIENPEDIKNQVSQDGSLDYADDEFLSNLGEDVIIKAYFPEDVNLNELKLLIYQKMENIKLYLNTGKAEIIYNYVDDRDWENEWKKYYKTFEVTKNIVIQPSWENEYISNQKIIIKMDPGMAFGTGTHETTKMCIELLEKYIKKNDSLLDVGCGSGILSIIAEKLGANSITAFDIDSTAIKVARENFKNNSIEKKVSLKCGVLKDIFVSKYNIVVANVIANVIIEIASSVKNYLKKDGIIIVSGIIKEREQDVIVEYEKLGYKFIERLNLGEWVAIVFRCQDFL